MRVLVVRPQPGAAATAARVTALGHAPLLHPLLATEPADWTLPATPPDAVILTSAAAVRLAGPQAQSLLHLPALCVGTATAAAARAAGWTDVQAQDQMGPGTVQALLDGATAGPHRHLLHLAGEDRTATQVPPGLTVEVVILYRAVLQPLPLLPDATAVLLHSPRTARQFASEWDRLGGQRAEIAVHAISAATLAAAGPGWRAAHTAAHPDNDALLATLPKAG
jgi:uroporphyrinogen-III synthase